MTKLERVSYVRVAITPQPRRGRPSTTFRPSHLFSAIWRQSFPPTRS